MWPFKRKSPPLPDPKVRSWNLMHFATDPDRNWNFARNFRSTNVPASVLTCETTFIMASIARSIIRNQIDPSLVKECIASAEKAFHQSFDNDSKEPLPAEMQAIYGARRLNEIAAEALREYEGDDDLLVTTVGRFVFRINGDPRMRYEVLPDFEQRQEMLTNAFGID
jgi:hypothetical protein